MQNLYLVWKTVDDSTNCWPAGQTELLDIYYSEKQAIERVESEKNNFKFDIMPYLHALYNPDILKISRPKDCNKKRYNIVHADYGDISVTLFIEERQPIPAKSNLENEIKDLNMQCIIGGPISIEQIHKVTGMQN